MMTYLLLAIAVLGFFGFAGWRAGQRRRPRAAPLHKVLTLPAAYSPDGSWADVASALDLALKRLLPVMVSRGVRADVAVRPGLAVRLSSQTLEDLLEELLAAAIHNAQAGRLLLTAVPLNEQVLISVTDHVVGADPALRAGNLRGLAERVALRGGRLDVEVLPRDGTTITMRIAAAQGRRRRADHTGAAAATPPIMAGTPS